MVEEDRTARLELVLVHEGQDGDVVLGADTGRDDRVVVVNDLLEVADGHGCAAEVVDLAALLLVLLLLRLEALLVLDKLLLHQEVVLDPLLLQQPQPTLRG